MQKPLSIYLPELQAKLSIASNGRFVEKTRETLQEEDSSKAATVLASLKARVADMDKEEKK